MRAVKPLLESHNGVWKDEPYIMEYVNGLGFGSDILAARGMDWLRPTHWMPLPSTKNLTDTNK